MRDLYKEGQESFRDLVISYIIGLQNEKYWREETEGYMALQDLMSLIIERHGRNGEEYKG